MFVYSGFLPNFNQTDLFIPCCDVVPSCRRTFTGWRRGSRMKLGHFHKKLFRIKEKIFRLQTQQFCIVEFPHLILHLAEQSNLQIVFSSVLPPCLGLHVHQGKEEKDGEQDRED